MDIDFQPENESSIDFQPVGKVTDILQIKPTTREDVINRNKGIAQGAENVGIGFLNLLPGVNISKANWAGENPEAKKGEMMSEFGSFFLPGAGLKAAHYIPMIGNALKATVKGLESRPILNALAKMGKASGETALSSAALANEGEKGNQALLGGGIGAGTNLLHQAFNVKNPFVGALLRALVGGGAGAAYGGATGQNPLYTGGAGAVGAMTAPHLLKAAGFTSAPAGIETIEHLTPGEVAPALEASRRLGMTITPAEASGNPFVGGLEGGFGRGSEAAAEKTRIGQGKIVQQNEAIKDLLDTIHDKSSPQAAKASNKKIEDLYTEANKWHLGPDEVTNLKNDPVIDEAFRRVNTDVAYKRKLAGIPENNYAYLNQVKRALQDMEGAALKAGEKDRAAEFKDARTNLTDIMDTNVPVYKQAREEAQKSIIRSNIQKAMKKKEIKGSTFFNTLLKNEDQFNDLRASLKNVPEAQDMLDDMRLAWKNLIDIEKPKNVAYRTETGLNQSRNATSKLIDLWTEMTGSKRNIEALRFIHSPDWDKAFARIAEIKDRSKRTEALTNLLAKLTSAGAMTSQGSDKHGDRIPSSG
jgi:hypothetical protein